jgi:hypothetical protein
MPGNGKEVIINPALLSKPLCTNEADLLVCIAASNIVLVDDHHDTHARARHRRERIPKLRAGKIWQRLARLRQSIRGLLIFKPAAGAISCAEANALGISIISPFSRYSLTAKQRNGDANRFRSSSGK